MVKARATVHGLGGLELTNSLCAVLSGTGRRGGLGTGARDSAGADAPAELVLHQHLRNVFLDARDCYPAWRSCRRFARNGDCRSAARVDELFKDPTQKTAAFNWSKQLLSWKNLFSGAGPRAEAV